MKKKTFFGNLFTRVIHHSRELTNGHNCELLNIRTTSNICNHWSKLCCKNSFWPQCQFLQTFSHKPFNAFNTLKPFNACISLEASVGATCDTATATSCKKYLVSILIWFSLILSIPTNQVPRPTVEASGSGNLTNLSPTTPRSQEPRALLKWTQIKPQPLDLNKSPRLLPLDFRSIPPLFLSPPVLVETS